jgi:hypothetical protein
MNQPGRFRQISLQLRPALITLLFLIGTGAGILLGTLLSAPPSGEQAGDREEMIGQFVSENFLHEINGFREEQILLLK